jgi:hypothetical protein
MFVLLRDDVSNQLLHFCRSKDTLADYQRRISKLGAILDQKRLVRLDRNDMYLIARPPESCVE